MVHLYKANEPNMPWNEDDLKFWVPKWKRHDKSDYWQKLTETWPDEPPEKLTQETRYHYDYAGGVLKAQDLWLKYGMKKFIDYSCDYENKIVYITWNRPEKLNAGCPCPACEASLVARDDPDCKVIVWRGNGRAFGAGYDITPDIGYGCKGGVMGTSVVVERSGAVRYAEGHREEAKNDWYRIRCWDNPKPILVMVHGYVIAGANDSSTKCDLVYATPDALFGHSILPRGTPSIASHTFNPFLFGFAKAREICYTGNLLPAQEMYNVGYVAKVLPKNEIEEHVDCMAQSMANLPSVTLAINKRAINNHLDAIGKRAHEDYVIALRSLCGSYKGGDEHDYGSRAWAAATRAKGLSYHLRARDGPFAEADSWWRERVAARPKFEKGRLEEGWEARKDVLEAKKVIEELAKKKS
jgi:enoyl-CoA hydratase/carnithine racemase